MEHLGGKKERRSQKDKRRSEKLKGKRKQEKKPKEPKNPYGKKKYDPEAEKQRKEKRKRDVAEGRAGLPGAGRAGRQPTKKQKEKSRKQKHKKRLYAAVAKVASQNPEFAKLLKAELKAASVDAVRGTAFNVARMLKGKVKEIPIDRIPDLRNYRDAKFVLDPAASVAYLVKDIDAYWAQEVHPTRDPQDAFMEEREGTYSVLFYSVLTKSGGHPGMVFLLSEEGKLPWQGSGLDEDYRVRRWQDKEIAKWIEGSFENDLEPDWEYERDKYEAMQEDAWEARQEMDREMGYERYASGMRTAPVRTVVPPSFDSNQWRYFKGPAKTGSFKTPDED